MTWRLILEGARAEPTSTSHTYILDYDTLSGPSSASNHNDHVPPNHYAQQHRLSVASPNLDTPASVLQFFKSQALAMAADPRALIQKVRASPAPNTPPPALEHAELVLLLYGTSQMALLLSCLPVPIAL